jgi:DNA-binding MarR family transcriptional regulator
MKNHGTGAGLNQAELKRYPGYLLARARFGAFRNFEEHIGRPFELRPVEFSVLLLVQTNGDVSQSQLSQALGVAAPNMTTILRRLEARELLAREQSPRDGRIQHIVLTAKGRKLLRDARAAGAAMDRQWLARLSPAEQAMLFELLAKLVGEAGPTA